MLLESVHDEHGATYTEVGGRRVVDHYGRPERVHRAVRNVVGVIEHNYGVLTVMGDDRVDFVDNAVSNRVPTANGECAYALLLDPQGRIRTDMYVCNAGERLLVLTPPGEAEPLAEDWREKTFIQDVDIERGTDEFAIFGVHGPQATEKIASVCTVSTPSEHLSFVRGTMVDDGVTVIRDDGLAGEEGYLVVAAADAAERVFDVLENRGVNAAPFGHRTWESLTLEAGTPLFEPDLAGELPNDLGLRTAVDYEKGCFVGQEVVSRIENRGQPGSRLVGLRPEAVPDGGAAVFAGDESVGTVTRALESPELEAPIAFALLNADVATGEATAGDATLTIRVDGEEGPADRASLPFVEGSDESVRRPRYD